MLKVLVVAGRTVRTRQKPKREFVLGLDRALPRAHRAALKVRASRHHELFDGDTPWPTWSRVADPVVREGTDHRRCRCCPNGPEFDDFVEDQVSQGYGDATWRRWCDGLWGRQDVRTYLTLSRTREAVIANVAGTVVSWQPDVVIGHSLGAVVAVEALARSRAEHAPSAALTLGAPFPWPRFVERWSPEAREWLLKPRATWLNVVDLSDPVTASVVPAPEVYGGAEHVLVNNDHHVRLWPWEPGWDFCELTDVASTHAVRHYLNHPPVAELFGGLLTQAPDQAA